MQLLEGPLAGGRAGEMICLSVVLAAHVRDREDKRAGQFPADPVQGIEARAPAAILARHLADDHF